MSTGKTITYDIDVVLAGDYAVELRAVLVTHPGAGSRAQREAI